MISRVADHCFWFGRYLERTASTARALSVTHTLSLGSELSAEHIWRPVIIVAGEEQRFTKLLGHEHAHDAEQVQHYMTWDKRNQSSLRASVGALRENARAIRDQLSKEPWVVTNQLHHWLAEPDTRGRFEIDRHGFYEHIEAVVQQLRGCLSDTMIVSDPLHFIQLGMRLERASQTARTLDVHHHAYGAMVQQDVSLENANAGATPAPGPALQSPIMDTAVWLSLLRAIGGMDTFMKRNRGRVNGAGVVEFLFCEPRFPRSITCAIMEADQLLREIRPPARSSLPGKLSQDHLGQLMRWVQAQDGPTIMRRGVHTVLTHVVNEVHAICEQIGGELLGQCPGPAAAQRSQRRTGQTGAGLEPSGPVKTSGVPGKTAGAA